MGGVNNQKTLKSASSLLQYPSNSVQQRARKKVLHEVWDFLFGCEASLLASADKQNGQVSEASQDFFVCKPPRRTYGINESNPVLGTKPPTRSVEGFYIDQQIYIILSIKKKLAKTLQAMIIHILQLIPAPNIIVPKYIN